MIRILSSLNCDSHKSSDYICVSVSGNKLREQYLMCSFDFQSKLLRPISEIIVLKANIFYLLESGLVQRGKALENLKETGHCVSLKLEKREGPWLMAPIPRGFYWTVMGGRQTVGWDTGT